MADNEAKEVPEVKEEKKGVKRKRNQNAKAHLITYQNTHRWGGITPEDFKETMLGNWGSAIKRLAAETEPYEEDPYEEIDGVLVERTHLQTCVEWVKKKRPKCGDERFALGPIGEGQYLWCAPNIKPARDAKNKRTNINEMMSYCQKERIHGYPGLLWMPPQLGTIEGADKWMRDEYAFKQLEERMESKEVEFDFPMMVYTHNWNCTMADKRRHIWIYGERDCGKSSNAGVIWAETNNIKHFDVEATRNGDVTGCFDSYKQQRLVIIEDKKFPLEELQRLCDYTGIKKKEGVLRTSKNIRPPVFWDKKMVIIVTDNERPGARYEEDWMQRQEFMARFTVIEVGKDINGRGKINAVW